MCIHCGFTIKLHVIKSGSPQDLNLQFSSEIDFAHNSSMNCTWRLGNKYNIGGIELFHKFLIGTFCHPLLCWKLSGELVNFKRQLLVIENKDHSKPLNSLVIKKDPLC